MARSTHRRSLLLAVAGVVTALGLTGCSSSVAASDIEADIESQLEEQGGTGQADCPEDLAAEEGATTTCTVTSEAGEIELEATVTAVDGDEVSYDLAEVE